MAQFLLLVVTLIMNGKVELHWGSGISHTGEDIFVSADLEGSSVSIKEEATSSQLGSYNSAGWANLTDDQERAVFFLFPERKVAMVAVE